MSASFDVYFCCEFYRMRSSTVNMLYDTPTLNKWIYIYDFDRFDILCLDKACVCTSEYNVQLYGQIVQDYCKDWNPDRPGDEFCYLRGGMSSSSCPGAQRSTKGKFYWTQDQTICNSAIGKLHKAYMKCLYLLRLNDYLLNYFYYFKYRKW